MRSIDGGTLGAHIHTQRELNLHVINIEHNRYSIRTRKGNANEQFRFHPFFPSIVRRHCSTHTLTPCVSSHQTIAPLAQLNAKQNRKWLAIFRFSTIRDRDSFHWFNLCCSLFRFAHLPAFRCCCARRVRFSESIRSHASDCVCVLLEMLHLCSYKIAAVATASLQTVIRLNFKLDFSAVPYGKWNFTRRQPREHCHFFFFYLCRLPTNSALQTHCWSHPGGCLTRYKLPSLHIF